MSNNDKPIKITLFHMNGCGPCKAFKSEWEKLSANTQKNICFSEYESMQLGGLPESEKTINGEEIAGFPTIKINIFDKEYDYAKERTQLGILEFVRDMLKNKMNGGGKDDNDECDTGLPSNSDCMQSGGSLKLKNNKINKPLSIFSRGGSNNHIGKIIGSDFRKLVINEIDTMSDFPF